MLNDTLGRVLDDEDIEDSKNIVQPDIYVICNRNNLTDKSCTGSPDIIIEVGPMSIHWTQKVDFFYAA